MEELVEYGKNVIRSGINSFKNKIKKKISKNPYVIGGTVLATFLMIIFFTIIGAAARLFNREPVYVC